MSLMDRALALDEYRTECAILTGQPLPWSWRRLAEQLATDQLLSQTTVLQYAKLAGLSEAAQSILHAVQRASLTTLIGALRDLPPPGPALLERVRTAVAEADAATARFRDPSIARAARQAKVQQVRGFQALVPPSATPTGQGDRGSGRSLFVRTVSAVGPKAPALTITVQAPHLGQMTMLSAHALATALERASLELEDAARQLRATGSPEPESIP